MIIKSVLSTPVLIVSKFLVYRVEEKTKYKDFTCFYENTNSEICEENTSYKNLFIL
jgi:hypothetical protein